MTDLAHKNKQVTILLVDDDDVDALGIKRAFGKMRIANPLVRAKNGMEALELLRGDLCDTAKIVLLDLNMPVMDGFEFLDALREDPELKSTVVFVLTTSKSDEDMTRAYRKNIAGYIVKNEMDTSFNKLIDMLSAYWRVIELPGVETSL